MRRQIHVHDHPDRCVIGTLGQPGQRTFVLQARSGRRVTSVVVEKEQARMLAERVDELLDDMIERGHLDRAQGSLIADLADNDPLDTPVTEEFRAGALGLGWNAAQGCLVMEAFAADAPGDTPDLESDSDVGPDTLRVRLSGPAAREFARRTHAVVAAGRPPCPFCQLPLDPGGHVCPRANGYRR
jgi:uncharacterized repeat protein (TIGR03847 family)